MTRFAPANFIHILASRLCGLLWSLRRVIALSVVVAIASASDAASLNLEWTDNSDNEVGFEVERSADGATYGRIGVVGSDTVSFQDASGEPGKEYWYRVRAYNEYGYSGYTNIVNTTFPITVIQNAAPTITGLTNGSIVQGATSLSLPFSVSDLETAAGSLTVQATRSNAAVVKSVAITGSGAERSLVITPVADAVGSSSITVSVSDGSESTQQTISFEVRANTVPSITPLGSIQVAAGGSSQPVEFQVSDLESPASALQITTFSLNSNIISAQGIRVAQSSKGAGYYELTLTAPVGVVGQTEVYVSVSDGVHTVSGAAVVSVVAATEPLPAGPAVKIVRFSLGEDVSEVEVSGVSDWTGFKLMRTQDLASRQWEEVSDVVVEPGVSSLIVMDPSPVGYPVFYCVEGPADGLK